QREPPQHRCEPPSLDLPPDTLARLSVIFRNSRFRYPVVASQDCATDHPSSAISLALVPRSAALGPLALPSFARIAIPCEMAAARKNENATKNIRSGTLVRPTRRQ